MATRKNAPNTKVKGPTTVNGWNLLLSKGIRKAEATGDPRLASLQKAMLDGKAEMILRRYGILTDVDISREFPE